VSARGKCSFPEKEQLTHAEAKARARFLSSRPGATRIQSYRCPAGGHYHVGHRHGRKRQQS
jgi:hypothetical protein